MDFVGSELQGFWGIAAHRGHRIVEVVHGEDGALFLVEREEAILEDALPDFCHEAVVEKNVVLADELPAERLLALREVVQVGAGVAGAGRAGAIGIERLARAFINATPELQESTRSEGSAALRDLRGDNAIEHVHATVDRFQNIERSADTHEVSGFVFRQKRGGEFAGVLSLALALADGEAADRVAVERHRTQRFSTFFAEAQMQRALDNGEHGLRGITPRREAACGPAVGEFHRGAGDGFIDCRRHALIEDHHDVTANGDLRFNAALGAQENRAAVEVALKNGSLFGHRARVGQGKNLESARVGEDGALPAHEWVDAADLAKNLGSGTQEKVVGIGEEDLGTRVVKEIGCLGFHRRMRADGHEQRSADLVMKSAKSRGAGSRGGGASFELELERGFQRP